MLARMLFHIDQLSGLSDCFECRLEDGFRFAYKSDDRAVMILVHLLVEHLNAVDRFYLSNNGSDLLWVSPFGKIGHAFNKLGHPISFLQSRYTFP